MKCEAKLEIADDFGDNHATMTCDLDKGHEGPHQETYTSSDNGKVVVSWEGAK